MVLDIHSLPYMHLTIVFTYILSPAHAKISNEVGGGKSLIMPLNDKL